MAGLGTMIFGNPLSAWLTALGIALAINVVVGVVKWAVVHHLARLVQKSETALDDSVVETARRTRQWLVFFVTLYVGAQYLALPERADLVLRGAATVAFVVQVGLWLGALLEFWIGRSRALALAEDAGTATTLSVVNFAAKLALWSLLLLLGLDNLGVDVTALVAGLGVGGIAVALAVQSILGDLFASLSIAVDKPFVLGDFIIVDSYMGTIEHIGLKTTRIRSLGGEQIVFSNSDLLATRLRNYKRMRERRIVFGFGVLYQTPAAQLEKIPGMVRDIIASQPLARLDRAHFQKFGESSLDFEVVYWMKDPDYTKYMDTQQAINLALVRRFEQEKIGFAYPTRSLYVEAPVRVEVASRPAE
jgi:small-conductance mechanosensitive channel